MQLAPGAEWLGGIDGRLRLASGIEARSVEALIEHLRSVAGSLDPDVLSRLGSAALFIAICTTRTTTAGFAMAAAEQTLREARPALSDPELDATFEAGVTRLRDHLERLWGAPGGTLADAALAFMRLLAEP